MPKQLTVHNATITTAAVEVKTLTISGKQVTLAVFRQLREEPLIADDGTLNGVPWGYVNYHPNKCEGSRTAHWHIVWQRGNELLRAGVTKIPDFDPEDGRRGKPAPFYPQAANRLLTGRVREWLHGRIETVPLPTSGNWNRPYDDECGLGAPFGFTVWATASDAAMDAANKKHKAEREADQADKARQFLSEPTRPDADLNFVRRQRQSAAESAAEAEVTAKAALAEALAKLDAEVDAWGLTYRELHEALTSAAQAEANRRQQHRDTRAALADLPQLFIAV